MKNFYAATNAYSTENSIGFYNTWYVLAFNSKKERDEFVEESDDLATRAITRKEIRKYADSEIIQNGWNSGRKGYIVKIANGVGEYETIVL